MVSLCPTRVSWHSPFAGLNSFSIKAAAPVRLAFDVEASANGVVEKEDFALENQGTAFMPMNGAETINKMVAMTKTASFFILPLSERYYSALLTGI
jgi:hypothetical protein